MKILRFLIMSLVLVLFLLPFVSSRGAVFAQDGVVLRDAKLWVDSDRMYDILKESSTLDLLEERMAKFTFVLEKLGNPQGSVYFTFDEAFQKTKGAYVINLELDPEPMMNHEIAGVLPNAVYKSGKEARPREYPCRPLVAVHWDDVRNHRSVELLSSNAVITSENLRKSAEKLQEFENKIRELEQKEGRSSRFKVARVIWEEASKAKKEGSPEVAISLCDRADKMLKLVPPDSNGPKDWSVEWIIFTGLGSFLLGLLVTLVWNRFFRKKTWVAIKLRK